jgi:hypothetical protein
MEDFGFSSGKEPGVMFTKKKCKKRDQWGTEDIQAFAVLGQPDTGTKLGEMTMT